MYQAEVFACCEGVRVFGGDHGFGGHACMAYGVCSLEFRESTATADFGRMPFVFEKPNGAACCQQSHVCGKQLEQIMDLGNWVRRNQAGMRTLDFERAQVGVGPTGLPVLPVKIRVLGAE